MKNKDIYDIKKILEKLSNRKGKIAYPIFRNIEIINTLINTLDRFITKDEYEKKRIEICEKYSKNKNIVKNKYIINDHHNFNIEMDDLDYNFIKSTEIFNSNCNIQFYKIDKNDIPNYFTANDIKEISFMIYFAHNHI